MYHSWIIPELVRNWIRWRLGCSGDGDSAVLVMETRLLWWWRLGCSGDGDSAALVMETRLLWWWRLGYFDDGDSAALMMKTGLLWWWRDSIGCFDDGDSAASFPGQLGCIVAVHLNEGAKHRRYNSLVRASMRRKQSPKWGGISTQSQLLAGEGYIK